MRQQIATHFVCAASMVHTAAKVKKKANEKRAWVATVQLKVLQITKVIPEMNNKQHGLVNERAQRIKSKYDSWAQESISYCYVALHT